MPGYKHLYLVDTTADVISHLQELLDTAHRLEALGLKTASNETFSIWSELVRFEEPLKDRVNKVREVWKYIEWFDSGYCDSESVQRAFNDFARNLNEE